MACSGCSTGRGNSSLPKGCKNNGLCGSGCNKLNVFDWLSDVQLPQNKPPFPVVEVRFKNSRKEFFYNPNNLPLKIGDVIAVEASPGHDIGIVSLTGELVKVQMQRKKVDCAPEELKKVYRIARQGDIDKWQEAQALEEETMHEARRIAADLKLEMKISDVEYQGDKTKAIFYYTAEQRVDFRELIKILADKFKIRVEMRQIGARQEASRLGGIGSCGRELCCSTWLTDFRSVSTTAARYQQLSLNPSKLAGQCGKLKCCLNYELDSYVDALKAFPNTNIKLKTKMGDAKFLKMDIFKNLMWYTYEGEVIKFIPIKTERVNEIIEMNKNNQLPEDLNDFAETIIEETKDYTDLAGQESLTRFDNLNKPKKNKRKKRNNKNRKNNNKAKNSQNNA
jgi:cell fate regulator YaaT (PSP1 superfamily)